jgi:hypothetical protein
MACAFQTLPEAMLASACPDLLDKLANQVNQPARIKKNAYTEV